jgi:DNA transformation protein
LAKIGLSNSGFVEYIVDLLSAYGNIKVRKMFGGYGLYYNAKIFAIIIDDELYFKADKALAEEFKLSGSYPFTYKRDDKTVALGYYYVPSKIFEDDDRLKEWFYKVIRVI